MTEQEAETCQQWRGMDGVTAFHLIERHADNWEDIAMMMEAWRRANEADAIIAEREACAKVCDSSNADRPEDWTEYAKVKAECAAAIRMRSNADVTGLAPGKDEQ